MRTMRAVDPRVLAESARARLAQNVVAFALGEPEDEIGAPTRGSKSVAFARQVAMYATHVAFGMSLARVAVAFNRDRSTVAHACGVIEDHRDDPAFDELLDSIEAVLRHAPAPPMERRP